MHIRLNFHLHENNQRSIKNTTVYTVYISRSNLHQKFQEKRKKLKNF